MSDIEFKVGETFQYLGKTMLIASFNMYNVMTVHYFSDRGELKSVDFSQAELDMVRTHITNTNEYLDGLSKIAKDAYS